MIELNNGPHRSRIRLWFKRVFDSRFIECPSCDWSGDIRNFPDHSDWHFKTELRNVITSTAGAAPLIEMPADRCDHVFDMQDICEICGKHAIELLEQANARIGYERAERMRLTARIQEVDPPEEVHGT